MPAGYGQRQEDRYGADPSYTPRMADAPSVPSYADLLWPTSKRRALGGSGSINEIVEKVVELEGFTEEQQAVPPAMGRRARSSTDLPGLVAT